MSARTGLGDASSVARPAARLTAIFAAVTVMVVAGCGVSFQSVYEGNVRFEHCHRLDMDERVAPTYRERCWREWLDHYTFGQTRDRLDYARRRVAELAGGDTSPGVSPDSVDAGKPVAAAEAPAPTSAHAPPPPTAPAQAPDSGPPGDAGSDAATPPPEGECVQACHRAWKSCMRTCPDAGKKGACDGCGKDYRGCMRRCFK